MILFNLVIGRGGYEICKKILLIVTGIFIVRALLLNVNETSDDKVENKVNVEAKR